MVVPYRRYRRCHAVVVDRGKDFRVRHDTESFSCVSCPQRDPSSCRIRRRHFRMNFRRNFVASCRCSNLRGEGVWIKMGLMVWNVA